jgi:hypothetical protein
MATRVKVEHFDRINKSKLKNASIRTRTGALKAPVRAKAHTRAYKHR